MALDLDPRRGDDADLLAPRRPLPPRTWRDRVEALADATGVTPTRLVAGALLLVAAAVGIWWLLRPPPAPTELSLPYASTTAAGAPFPAPSPTVVTEVVVHVAGAVVSPGVHSLPPGARVVDAVDAAGGLRADADPARVNLAAVVADGARVYVPALGEVAPPAVEGDALTGAGDTASGPVDLNAASEAELDELPGVGPTTAAAIVEHRELIGRFTSVDQLLDVRGIGEAKLEQLRPLVRV